MKIDDVRKTAFAMPLTSPSFPRAPYRFVDREFLIVTYRTGRASGSGSRTAADRTAHRQVRVHPDAGFHGVR